MFLSNMESCHGSQKPMAFITEQQTASNRSGNILIYVPRKQSDNSIVGAATGCVLTSTIKPDQMASLNPRVQVK